MSKQKSASESKILDTICNLEKNYEESFTGQTKFLKDLVNKAMNLTDKEIKETGLSEKSFNDPFTFILDFLGRSNENRIKLAKHSFTKIWNDKVLFLGIQNLKRSKFSHLKKSFESENCEDIQECLRDIFCEKDGNNTLLLKKSPNFETLEKLFGKPNSTVTSVLYWLYPEEYIPFDENSKKLFKKLELYDTNGKEIEVKDDWGSYEKIKKALGQIKLFQDPKNKEKLKSSMIIALSFAARQFENELENILNKYIGGENKAKNIILTGIPGTGKTYSVMEFLKHNEKYEYAFVQFHPSYDYEDFIEGFKPVPSKANQIEFKLVNGIFKDLCKRAYADKEKKKTYVMVIDEINRANLSRVFGELLYCLEYRNEFVSTKMTTYIQSLQKQEEEWEDFSISTENSNIGKFAIPDNIIVLGTMNEVDRGIDAFDLALRRRFIWEEVTFNETSLRLYKLFFQKNFQEHIENLIKLAKDLNEKLRVDIGPNYTLGHTYYFNIINYFEEDYISALCELWNYHLKSIVREYCKIKFGDNELEQELEKYQKLVVGDKNCNG